MVIFRRRKGTLEYAVLQLKVGEGERKKGEYLVKFSEYFEFIIDEFSPSKMPRVVNTECVCRRHSKTFSANQSQGASRPNAYTVFANMQR